MKNLNSPPPEVNSPTKACEWIEQKVEGHELNANTGRMWIGATRALLEMLRPDEPQTLDYFKDNATELARRWSLANPSAGGSTGSTYASRARTAVSTYERWLNNPTGFRFDSRPSTPRKRREPEVKVSAQEAPQPTAPAANDPRPEMGSIPIPGKAPFRFEVPADLERADVFRIMWGLMCHCADFDPMSTTPPVPPAGTGIVPAA